MAMLLTCSTAAVHPRAAHHHSNDMFSALPQVRFFAVGSSAAVPPHRIAVVISDAAKVVFIANFKAASSSIKMWLTTHAHGRAACYKPSRNMTADELRESCCDWPNGMGVLSTLCLDERYANYLLFSWVRDPIAKFESGVRELWVQNANARAYSADEYLHAVLRSTSRRPWNASYPTSKAWLDQHLEPSCECYGFYS